VLTKAGFKIEAESKILANPADDHTKGVRDPSVAVTPISSCFGRASPAELDRIEGRGAGNAGPVRF